MANSLLHLLPFLTLLAFPIACEIDIWEPQTLKTLYKKKSIQYSTANFGVVPYGHSIIGTVRKSSPFNGCGSIKHYNTSASDGALIVLMIRGGCHFAEKVVNAQKIGANLVIIVDNQNEDVHEIMPVEGGKHILNTVRLFILFFVFLLLLLSVKF